MKMPDFIKQKKLVVNRKREQQKYLVLLSNDVVIIDNEWEAMKKAVRTGNPIVDMLPTHARMNAQTNVLSKVLESLEREK